MDEKAPCQTFKGNVKDTDRAVRLSINENGISGFIQLEDQKLFIEKTIKFKLLDDKPAFFVVYYEKDVINKDDIYCGVTSEEEKRFLEKLPKPADTGLRASQCKFLKIATDADFEYFQIYGASANAEILNIINLIEGVYINTFDVAPRVTFQNVWTTNDPYTGDPSTDPGSELLVNQLRNYWQANFTNVVRDVVHLFTGVGANTSGVVGRVFEIGTICLAPSDSYGYTKERFQAFLTTAHEIGHNFGGIHSDGVNCGTINAGLMCQGTKQIPMYFSAASITRMSNFINANSACLTPSQLYRILGNSPICNLEIYTVSNLPTGGTVTGWSAQPSGAVTISGSGSTVTVTRNAAFSGQVTLSVVITEPCGIYNISREIQVGTPMPIIDNVWIHPGLGMIDLVINPVPGATAYEYYLDGVLQATISSTFYYFYPPCGNEYRLSVKAIGPCGTSGEAVRITYLPC